MLLKNPWKSHAPGEIPNYLAQENVNILIIKGIDGRAISFFEQLGIQVIRGAFGTVNEILKQFNKQQLQDRECEFKDKFHRY